MTLTSSIARVRHYHRTHGTAATLRRVQLGLQRLTSAGQFVLYSCDLPVAAAPAAEGAVERNQSDAALAAGDLHRLVSHWNPELMRRQMFERFAAGAELWLLRCQGTVAGYGWTLKGKTLEPHFIPLEPGDIHLFDFLVFPEFRGRGLNPALVGHILSAVGREGGRRAFIEAAMWNVAQHSSLAKTPFKRLGVARKFHWGKSTMVLWGDSNK